MIESIRLKRQTTNPLSIGEVIDYRGATFVITHILGIEVVGKHLPNPTVVYYCLGQQFGTPDLSSEYLPILTELSFKSDQFDNLPEVGEIFFDNALGIWVNIDEITNVRFEDTEMFITFKFSPVPEWSKEQLTQAMNRHRLNRMKLVRKDTNQAHNF